MKLSRDFVGTVERGEQAATVDTLAKLARALGVDAHAFDAATPNQPSDPDSTFARRVALASKGAPPDLLEAYSRMTEAFFEGLAGRRTGRRGRAGRAPRR